jgi:transcriptional regulator with XRE-family HTH domain
MTHVSRRLAHSLRVYRKRSGLSQREASFLLGVKHGGKVSRYENRRRIPPLRTALAYSIILDVPLPELFPHLQREVQAEVARQMLELQVKLAQAQKRKRGSRRAARMIEWLKECHTGITTKKSS